MKAVVLEIKDGYAAVLSEDGQFRKIKDDGYCLGMELTLEKTEQNTKRDFGKLIDFSSKRLWSGVATIAAALLIFVGVKDFNTPYGTISLDVNPSIEISINRYDRVLSIEAVNDDATEIVDVLNSSGLKYKSVDDAVDMALSSFTEADYAADDGTTYVVISANSGSDKHSDKIASELDSLCSEHKDISAQTITADDELCERAKKSGTTAGKLYLVDSLKELSDEDNFDESDWLKKPVKDIIRKIDELEEPAQDMPNDLPQDAQDQPEPKEKPTDADENTPVTDQPAPQDKPAETNLENPDTDQPAPPEKPSDTNESEPDTNQPVPADNSTDTNENEPDTNQPAPPPQDNPTDEKQTPPEPINSRDQKPNSNEQSNPPTQNQPPEDFV